MSIAIASDHAGFELKKAVVAYLERRRLEYLDLGVRSEERVDYPDYGYAAAQAVASGQCAMGIIICGTGIGISITANKVRGIRAALCCSEYMAEMARKHNDANMLALGGRVISPEMAEKIVDVFLQTDFEGGRHAQRVQKIHQLTQR
ncbi:ribose 5-phosphate isomerase B [bacterium]|nr:ribose 5-phosphate isomerase B [bacterium]